MNQRLLGLSNRSRSYFSEARSYFAVILVPHFSFIFATDSSNYAWACLSPSSSRKPRLIVTYLEVYWPQLAPSGST